MDGILNENLQRQKIEEMEFNKIDAILPSLLEQHLITDMGCRVIAGHNQLLEKQGAVFKIIMSKTKEDAAHLFEIFRTLTLNIHTDELSKTCKTFDCNDEAEKNVLQDKPNPLLNDAVLACLFGYLPLDDIKDSRLVCLKWNSVADICLRKRCTIHFRRNGQTPQTFMEVSKYSLPDLPFPAYKFSGVDYASCEDHIENFFDKWGKNIKEVELEVRDRMHDRIYDITPWIAKTSSLSSLTIRCAPYNAEILFSISIDKLATLKTVFLENCRILSNGERVTFVPSSNVSLIDVSFQRLGNAEVLQEFCYNEFLDFSQTVNLALSNQYRDEVKFDMAGQIFNKTQLDLRHVTLNNLTQAKGDVNLLILSGCDFTERNQLKITRMTIDNSEVNLSVLPQTLEKLSIGGEVKIVSKEPFQLPNLKFLRLKAKSDNSRNLPFLLENCPNMTEVELLLGNAYECITLDLDSLPRSVKKLKVAGGMTCMIEFANGDQILELNSLLLESIDQFSDCKRILEKIKPKLLVISYHKWVEPLDPFEFSEIILANKQIGTIVVGTVEDNIDLCEKIPLEGSASSFYVDKKSNYYKFVNQVGHAIERKEFEEFISIADMGDDY